MQSTIHTTDTQPTAVVIGAEVDEDANYRTVSVLALVSLGLALLSPLVFFGPLLMIFPIASAVLGLLALRQIATSDGALIGRAAALVGIAVSVAGITAGFTRTELSQYLLSRQARTTALEWLSLLQQGDAEQAFLLMSTSSQRPPHAHPGAPTEQPAESPLDIFRASPVVHFMLEHAGSAPVQYDGDTAYELFTTGEARIQQQYSVSVPPVDGNGTTSTLNIVVLRSRGYAGGPFQWRISSATSDDLPVEPHEHSHAGHVH